MRPLLRNAFLLATVAVPLIAAENVQRDWDGLLKQSATAPPSAITTEQFLEHLFFETRSEYTREQTFFTGNPTITGVIDAPLSQGLGPAGIPYPAAFQPSANILTERISFGTRGWLSPRLNTRFSARYQQELTPVDHASPAYSLLSTFHDGRRLEWTEASVEVNAAPGVNFTLGRQYAWGAELASFDGAKVEWRRERYSVELFGGRRFSFYRGPTPRPIGGAALSFRASAKTIVSYDALLYIRATHLLRIRHDLTPKWTVAAGLRLVGSAPVDLTGSAFYSSKATLRIAASRKLTSRDYIYDYTSVTPDPRARLNLGPLNPYTQFAVEGRRPFGSRWALSCGVWVRRLDTEKDQGPFETSFEDYRAGAEFFAARKTQLTASFHQRNSDRLSPANETTFDNISQTGETRVQDFTAEVRQSFGDGRLALTAGAFYRRIRIQSRYIGVQNTQEHGFLGGMRLRVDSRTQVWFDWTLDNDFFLFRPDIRNSQVFRTGVAWRF